MDGLEVGDREEKMDEKRKSLKGGEEARRTNGHVTSSTTVPIFLFSPHPSIPQSSPSTISLDDGSGRRGCLGNG